MWIALFVMLLVVGTVGLWFWTNLNYDRNDQRVLARAGFIEKQVTLTDGTVLNYGEGPAAGPPLLLIHGQQTSWTSYVRVLPELARHFHVFAVDKHGHGGSSKDPDKYSARAMGADLATFIEQVIGQPVYLSGHSSGALLSVWLAANSAALVRAVVLEDPPLFATEPGRAEDTFAWRDSFRNIHNFLQQDQQSDYTRYYLEHSELRGFFGSGWDGIVRYANRFLDRNPGRRLRIFFLPASLNRAFDLLDGDYDLQFGDKFYDFSWFEGFNQAAALAAVTVPTTLIHASWRYSDDGVLLAAMDGEDAARAMELLRDGMLVNIKSGHNVHGEKPRQFVAVLLKAFGRESS